MEALPADLPFCLHGKRGENVRNKCHAFNKHQRNQRKGITAMY